MLRQTGIEVIGDVAWGTHFSQFYESKEDLIDILVPYFKTGLESNEFCLWITANSLSKKEAEAALAKSMDNFDDFVKKGQIVIVSYNDFYLKGGEFSLGTVLEQWITLSDKVVSKGYDGLRACGDEGWLTEENWDSFKSYEEKLEGTIGNHKIIVVCAYSLKSCRASDIIDVVNYHQFALVRKNGNWEVIENSRIKSTKEKLERAKRLYAVISKINQAIIRINDLQLLYDEACRIAVEDGLFKTAWIGLCNEEDDNLVIVSQWGCTKDYNTGKKILNEFSKEPLSKGGPAYKAVKTGECAVCYEINKDSEGFPWAKLSVSKGILSSAAFPLKINNKIKGVISFYSTEYSFKEKEEIACLKSLSDNISFAMEAFEKEAKRLEMENELKQSEERYRKIVELSPDAIWVHVDGKIKFTNQAGLEIIGATKLEGITGKSILEFIHEDYRDIIKKRQEVIQKDGTPVPPLEQKVVRLDGTTVDVEVTGASFPYEGKNSIITIARDISERRRMEQLKLDSERNIRLLDEVREYDKLKTEFFANISHELRTPINVILSAIQLMNLNSARDNEEANIKINKYIYTMQQNCYRLLRLISNLIDITKIDTGYYEINLVNHNIVSIVEDITLSITEYTENKGIKLVFDTDIEEKIIACDLDMIERIMLNLLSNAIKFTNPGGNISVNVFNKDEYVMIVVKDSGIGIPQDKLHLVFERFHQVDKSLTRSHEGSGIGLSLVKSLVEMHGGVITAKSEYKKGSEFIVILPSRQIKEKDIEENSIHGLNEVSLEKINIEFSDIYQ